MEWIYFLLGLIGSVLGFILSIVWWLLSFLFLPFLILTVLAAFALRYAYRAPMLKPYIDRFFARLSLRGQARLKRLLYLLTVSPVRVILRFLWFSVVHAFVNLWWRPRWSPWQRATGRRGPETGAN